MRTTLELSNQFILASNLNSIPISLDELIKIVKESGFIVRTYIESENFLKLQKLSEIKDNYKAFTLVKKEGKVIFYNDELAYGEKLYAIAHELGHLVLEHTPMGLIGFSLPYTLDDQTPQETEANIFAANLLAHAAVLKKLRVHTFEQFKASTLLDGETAIKIFDFYCKRNTFSASDRKVARKLLKKRRIKILCFSIAVSCILLSIGVCYFSSSVYITPQGHRYHKKECIYLNNKEDLERISIFEALKKGYFPCTICRP